MIYFESPHRIVESLGDVAELFPTRRIVLARELTKIHEEFLRGTAGELQQRLAARDSIRGEFTMLLERAKEEESAWNQESVQREYAKLLEAGFERMEAMKEVARRAGLAKREIYEMLQK